MKKFFKPLFLLFLPAFISAQRPQTRLDSLQLELKKAANDTARLIAYANILNYYLEINRDSAILYSEQSLSLAQKLKLKYPEARILASRGFALTLIGNYPDALESLYRALKLAEDPEIEKSVINLDGGASLQNARLNLLFSVHLDLGHLYGATGNNHKKVSEYLIAIEFAKSAQNNQGIMTATMNLGNGYLKLNQLDSALLYEQRAISMILNRTTGFERYDGFAFQLLGQIYQKKGDFNLSRDAYQKSEELYKKQNNLAGLPRTLNFLGEVYQIMKKPDSSLLYAKEALTIARKAGVSVEMKNAYKLLSDIYSDQHNKDSTLAYLKLYTELNDRLNKIERENLLAYQNIGFEEQLSVKKLEDEKIKTQTRTRTNALFAGLAVFLIIGLILYRNNRQKQKANKVLETTLSNLKSTQTQLIQSEKMASLGELTAGIAHEIQNPLNFVNNFSEVNTELIDEMKEQLARDNKQEAIEIANNIKENEQKINHHGKRADAIVKGMLQHSRNSSGQKEPTDINALCDEYLRLAYHGLRAKNKSFNAKFETDFSPTLPIINLVPQDIGRVILNLINNAFYAVNEKKTLRQAQGDSYEPTVSVSTKKNNSSVEISVKDNGNGIPQKVLDKIFQPFFTTKPTGQGTGLGLSLSYDIVTKGHGGELKAETKEGVGATFIILLPFS